MILDSLSTFDHSLFFAINHLPHGWLFNTVGILLSAGSGFIWFFLIGLIFLLRDRAIGSKAILAIGLAGIFTHLVVVVTFKPIIARPRPDLSQQATISVDSQIDAVVPLANFNDYAFPSGHATMAFSAAFILTKLRSKQSFYWYLLAILIALSRLYLGKHYPSDVVAGAAFGWGIGWIVLRILKPIFDRL